MPNSGAGTFASGGMAHHCQRSPYIKTRLMFTSLTRMGEPRLDWIPITALPVQPTTSELPPECLIILISNYGHKVTYRRLDLSPPVMRRKSQMKRWQRYIGGATLAQFGSAL